MGTKHSTPDIASLQALSLPELSALWQQSFRGPPPKQPNLVIRELAWGAQKKQRGGFDQRTKRLLQTAIREGRQPAEVASAPRASPTPRARPVLPTSARLVREWGEERHEVVVLDGGKAFEYRGERYRSLSTIAKAITGTHCSGPRFFGLTGSTSTTRRTA